MTKTTKITLAPRHGDLVEFDYEGKQTGRIYNLYVDGNGHTWYHVDTGRTTFNLRASDLTVIN